jgi:hypothetical protein
MPPARYNRVRGFCHSLLQWDCSPLPVSNRTAGYKLLPTLCSVFQGHVWRRQPVPQPILRGLRAGGLRQSDCDSPKRAPASVLLAPLSSAGLSGAAQGCISDAELVSRAQERRRSLFRSTERLPSTTRGVAARMLSGFPASKERNRLLHLF